jgi:hypothetical protein
MRRRMRRNMMKGNDWKNLSNDEVEFAIRLRILRFCWWSIGMSLFVVDLEFSVYIYFWQSLCFNDLLFLSSLDEVDSDVDVDSFSANGPNFNRDIATEGPPRIGNLTMDLSEWTEWFFKSLISINLHSSLQFQHYFQNNYLKVSLLSSHVSCVKIYYQIRFPSFCLQLILMNVC